MFDTIKEASIENQPDPVDLKGTRLILSQMENCICKIVNDDGSVRLCGHSEDYTIMPCEASEVFDSIILK